MKKFAVILCGCGAMDGSEIHEAVMTLLAIDKQGSSYTIFALDEPQHHVVNFITKEEMPETRNMMVEAARIARGNIFPLTQLDPTQFDAVVFPGGFGVAKNLCSYAFDGAKMQVHPLIAQIVRNTHALHIPIGALCIAPVLIAKILGDITITVGDDATTIQDVEQMGATHVITRQTEVIADKQNKIFSTPCYMLQASITDIAESAENLIKTLLENL
ncbi:MAG: isoprenoid biosynthesis glyoxalase ElbB [Bacteroidales bacterium]|jgi:enhancing lycopene biosynthesis protein 2|nr:isoprenoid biosynthesis glyoxalase ElbB [Bacteroidales bacterium]